jgi:recombination protein RecA
MTVAVRPLPEVLDSLRGKGLRRGMTPLPGEPEPARQPAIPTGHAALDEALRTGGWPRGSLALLDGPPGSGGTSLALHALAACQADGGLAAWIDVEGCFDGAGAARLGVRLEWLLLVRPADLAEAVELAAWLARTRLLDLLVLDLERLTADSSLPGIDRLPQLLARTDTTTLALTGVRLRDAMSRAAGVRVALQRRAWLAVGRDLVGQRVDATVTRHRTAATGGRAELNLWFAEGRRIDPLLPDLAVAQPISEEARPAIRVLSA